MTTTATDSVNLATIDRVSTALKRAYDRTYDAVGIKGAEWAGTEGRAKRDAILDDARDIAKSVDDDIRDLPQPFRFALWRAQMDVIKDIAAQKNKAG